MSVGILHPGAMGASVAATVQNGGHEVWWLPEGRSAATHDRAGKLGFRPAEDLRAMAGECRVIISVCPPHAAEDVARGVVEAGFGGLFVEANAIAPRRVRALGGVLADAGADLVDGGILGLPVWAPGTTRLYLSGRRAEEAAALFSGGPVEGVSMGGEVGMASALKMCYAGYSKGSRALLWAVLGAAESMGVREALEGHWHHENPQFGGEVRGRLLATTPKAWRWVAEMAEIRETLEGEGLPPGFHEASGEVFERLSGFRDRQPGPDLDEAIRRLLRGRE
jgi:3-hydroxyisobutyrate dehydrogenase-like beta-hydroxyacid dehydrogenase